MPETSVVPRTRRPLRVFLLAFAGLVLIQSAWILVVPQFRGLDEHEHVYRASSVANGHFRPEYVHAENGRGDLIPVAEHIAVAARPLCEFLPYPGPDDCVPVGQQPSGEVVIASSAARYHPAYYWIIGTVGKPWLGADAVLAMRIGSTLMCALVLAAAVTMTANFARTAWPHVGLLTAITPVVLYSNGMAAPNGLELASAALVWVSLLAIAHTQDASSHRAPLLALLSGGVMLATLRSFGPVWLTLILGIGLVVIGGPQFRGLWRRHAWLVLTVCLVLALASLAGLTWSVTAGTNQPSLERGDDIEGSPWAILPLAVPLWILQSIAAFPARNEVAPALVYACFLPLYAGLVVLGLKWGRSREKAAILLVAGAAFVIPGSITIATYEQLGLAWQGRYSLPLSMGVFLIAGGVLNRTQFLRAFAHWSIITVVGTVGAVAVVTSLIGVRDIVRTEDVHAAWTAPSTLLLIPLTALGYSVLVATIAKSLLPAPHEGNHRASAAEVSTTRPR